MAGDEEGDGEGSESDGDAYKEGDGKEEGKCKGGESDGNGKEDGEGDKGDGDGDKEGNGEEEGEGICNSVFGAPKNVSSQLKKSVCKSQICDCDSQMQMRYGKAPIVCTIQHTIVLAINLNPMKPT